MIRLRCLVLVTIKLLMALATLAQAQHRERRSREALGKIRDIPTQCAHGNNNTSQLYAKQIADAALKSTEPK